MAIAPIVFTEAATGKLRIWQPALGVFLTQVTGNLEKALALSLTGTFEAALRRKVTHHVFHDWSAMTGNDVDARIELTQWSVRNRSAFAAAHLLVSSRIVRLGVQAANVVLGGFMTAHETRPTFEHAFFRTVGSPLSQFMGAVP